MARRSSAAPTACPAERCHAARRSRSSTPTTTRHRRATSNAYSSTSSACRRAPRANGCFRRSTRAAARRLLPAREQRLGAGDRARRRGRARDLPELQDPAGRGELEQPRQPRRRGEHGRANWAPRGSPTATAAGEYSSERAATYDGTTTTPASPITVSSGDSGYGVEFPAASPYVIAVGGTTLTLGAGNACGGETVWSGAGSGCSAYVAAAAWQSFDSAPARGKRGIADVSAVADPSTGVAVYDTVKYQGRAGWSRSAAPASPRRSSPASTRSPADCRRAAPASPPSMAHLGDGTVLHDVTSGSNGSCSTLCAKARSATTARPASGTPLGIGAF